MKTLGLPGVRPVHPARPARQGGGCIQPERAFGRAQLVPNLLAVQHAQQNTPLQQVQHGMERFLALAQHPTG